MGKKEIVVVGAGYVGLVTATCLAQKGNKVVVVENNVDKINSLLSGKIPFYEPGLDKLLKEFVENKNIIFIQNISQGLKYNPQILFSCVGTPSNEDGSANLTYVFNVAREVGRNLNQYCLFVNKSTVPVGTTKKIKNIIKKN